MASGSLNTAAHRLEGALSIISAVGDAHGVAVLARKLGAVEQAAQAASMAPMAVEQTASMAPMAVDQAAQAALIFTQGADKTALMPTPPPADTGEAALRHPAALIDTGDVSTEVLSSIPSIDTGSVEKILLRPIPLPGSMPPSETLSEQTAESLGACAGKDSQVHPDMGPISSSRGVAPRVRHLAHGDDTRGSNSLVFLPSVPGASSATTLPAQTSRPVPKLILHSSSGSPQPPSRDSNHSSLRRRSWDSSPSPAEVWQGPSPRTRHIMGLSPRPKNGNPDAAGLASPLPYQVDPRWSRRQVGIAERLQNVYERYGYSVTDASVLSTPRAIVTIKPSPPSSKPKSKGCVRPSSAVNPGRRRAKQSTDSQSVVLGTHRTYSSRGRSFRATAKAW